MNLDKTKLRLERQLNDVGDEVSALIAVSRPILLGVLYALRSDVVKEVGGYEKVKLKMISRLYRPGDGDCGICFEYAVHDAMNRGEHSVLERVSDALKQCSISGTNHASILFGVEKNGSQSIIDSASDILTDESRVLSGVAGQPAKLKRHLNMLAAAFRKPTTRLALPYSISGLWKADLFLGSQSDDRWVGTSVKINQTALEGANGLRVGIIPTRQGNSDAIRKDESKNLIVCPLPHDASFMQVFYEGQQIVQQFIAADANLPREVALARPAHREVARILADRREFSIIDVVEAIGPLAQPELLETAEKDVDTTHAGNQENKIKIGRVIAPRAKNIR